MREFWKIALSKRVAFNAIRIALFIGTLLNVINQGAAILAWEGIAWGHVVLNYIVPYCVATYSATKNELDRRKEK
jgi:hypothetical protein